MAKEAANKQPYILISIYESLYKERYNRAPSINRYREKWAMQDVIDSIGFDRAKAVLEYYFKTNKSGHPIQHFLFNFDKLHQVMIELDKDRDAIEKLLAETKQMVEEYEHRSSGN
jgi:hypothetical protein